MMSPPKTLPFIIIFFFSSSSSSSSLSLRMEAFCCCCVCPSSLPPLCHPSPFHRSIASPPSPRNCPFLLLPNVLPSLHSIDLPASNRERSLFLYKTGSVVAPRVSLSSASSAGGDNGDGASTFLPTALVESGGGEEEEEEEEQQQQREGRSVLGDWKPPRYLWRGVTTLVIAGQVVLRILQRRIHPRNSLQQLETVGPRSMGVCLLTASFVGMAFTIQFVREFTRLGLTRVVGGVLALALSRELSPVVTAIVVAGRVGSAFAAELGTMQVSEQTDTLRVLRTDPVDYLVTPRVIACSIALPILTLTSFTVGMAASVLLADSVYNVSANIILDSARKALKPWDFVSTMIKSTVFGAIISIVSCAWGMTTSGGAKGVGESTTSAVVISLVCIFIADFTLSWCFFQGAGDALQRLG